MQDQFSAAPSALGYLYQCEIALLEFLRREDASLSLSLEVLDDISFEGDQLELAQAKYHINPGRLTDGSADLWRTLRVWSETEVSYPEALLTLITTGEAPEGSVAALLRNDDQRDPEGAHSRLVAHARSSTSDSLRDAFAAFLALAENRRLAMVSRIVVVDRAPTIDDLDDAFDRALRLAAPRERRPALVLRLREWWLIRAEQHLLQVARGHHERIAGDEIEGRIADLRDQLSADNLPIDLEDLAAPSDEAVAEDQRTFVMQLRLIALANARIGLAIHDYNRAFAQRARWVREELVAIGELERYEKRLMAEWERLWLPETEEDLDDLSEEEAFARGRAVHRACDEAVVEPIRPRVTAPYVMRGSMQILADELRIGWHHDWVARMRAVLEGAGE